MCMKVSMEFLHYYYDSSKSEELHDLVRSDHVKGSLSLNLSPTSTPFEFEMSMCVQNTWCALNCGKNIVILVSLNPSGERTGLSTIASVESQLWFGGQVPRQVSHVFHWIGFWHVSLLRLPWTNWVMLEVWAGTVLSCCGTWDQQSVTHIKSTSITMKAVADKTWWLEAILETL